MGDNIFSTPLHLLNNKITLTQCWLNVGQPSQTVSHHLTNIVYCVLCVLYDPDRTNSTKASTHGSG